MEKHDTMAEQSSEKSDTNHNEKPSGVQEEPEITLEGGGFVEDKKRSKGLVRRIDSRILPLCAFVYLLNYLDRGNIGNGKVPNEETGDSLVQQTVMTDQNYAVAVSMFSLAYALFEVPSNWILKRYVRPSIWLGTLLLCWGLFTIGFGGVQTYTEVVVLSFFIGVFEAGFFPGIVYLIAMWYPVEERSVRIAFVLASATAAGAFGGAIAYGVGHLNNRAGLEGFRWLFILEGIITVLAVLPVIFFLPDYPARARWLNDDDKRYVEDRIQVKGGGYTKAHASKAEIMATVASPRMLCHYLAYLTDCIPLGSLTFFTPTIVSGLGFTSIKAQLMTVPPWIVGYCFCLFLGWSADRHNARGWHILAASTIGGIGWLSAGLLPEDAYMQRYGMLFVCACGAFPSSGPLSAWVTCNVPSIATMAIATALNNSCAGVSQIIAQWIWKPSEAEIGYPTGNFVCAACSFATAAIGVGLRLWYGHMNAVGAKDARGKDRIWLL